MFRADSLKAESVKSVDGASDALLDCEWAVVLRLLKLVLRYVGYSVDC